MVFKGTRNRSAERIAEEMDSIGGHMDAFTLVDTFGVSVMERIDPEIVDKARIILDLLLYDLASQSWRGRFISSSGRMYEKGKRYPERNGMQAVVDHIWDPAQWQREPSDRLGMDLNFLLIENYDVPPAIRAAPSEVAT